MSFFFNDTATTEIYTLSLHDALPICRAARRRTAGDREGLRTAARGRGRRLVAHRHRAPRGRVRGPARLPRRGAEDRKSTRLNSSHANISYAVFCLKKKKKICYELSLT